MKLLIFDLDGTLIDSKLDLAHAVNATRVHMNLPPLPHELIFSYVGNGAPVLMRRSLGPEATEEQVQQALEFFLAYYREHMLDYTTLYPGVAKTLDALLADEKRMAVLTNKPVRISKAIIEGLGLSEHFFQIYGGNSFEQKKPHPMGVEVLLSESGIDATKAMMVGDSAVDVQTARNAGIKACGVTYGFQPETLAAEPPDYLIDRFEQLPAVVNGK
jgi:phosphoglycolate phosphatase